MAGLAADAVVIVLAFIVTNVRIPPATIEHVYANGAFAWMNAAFVPRANAVPVAIGDLEGGVLHRDLAVVVDLAHTLQLHFCHITYPVRPKPGCLLGLPRPSRWQ